MLKILGPVYPICPAFKKNQEVDWVSTRKYIRYLLNNGAKNLIITAGTSRINLLNDKELIFLNKIVSSETKKKRAISIVSNHIYGDLKKTKEFIKKSIQDKANAILIYYSERYYGDDKLKFFFKQIDKICSNKIKFLIHAVKIRNEIPKKGPTVSISLNVFNYLIKLKSFGGIKEEFNDNEYRIKLLKKYKNKMNIITAGSSMRGFLKFHKFGVKSYLTSVGSFNPKIEENFFDLVYYKKDNLEGKKLINKYEIFFEDNKYIGWHLTMKTVLFLLGKMKIYEREPLIHTNKKIIKIFKKKLNSLNLKNYEI